MQYERRNFTLTQEDIDLAKEKAERVGVNLSAFIRMAIRQFDIRRVKQ